MLRTTLLTAVTSLSLFAIPALAQQVQMGGRGMPAEGASSGAQAQAVIGTGTVRAVDPARRVINLSHDQIPAIGWPQMTMDFAVDPKVDLSTLKPGQPVEFSLTPAGGGNYTVGSIKPKG